MGPQRLPIALRWTQEDDMERRAREVLSSLSVRLPSLRRPVKQLSGGQRQSVAVSRAVLWGSKVVLLDEPTAALGVEQTAMVHRLIVQLRALGLSVVLISHNLTDVFQVADRIIVLRLGRRVGTFTASQATTDQIVAAITTGGTEAAEGIL
jgi:D-xylose transport system ATP-binding protein